MILVAWLVAAAALAVALGAVAWAMRASNAAPFRAELARRDRQLDDTQRSLDESRDEVGELSDRLLDREGVIAQLTGQVEHERRRIDAMKAAWAEPPAIDLRHETVDER